MIKHKLATTSWDEREYQAIRSVVETGQFSMGEKVKLFEDNFAQKFGSKYAVMVNSGSSANLIMIASLFFTQDCKHRLQRGDEVIVPAVSWSTTYFPLQQYGLKVKFVDIDLQTLNYDLNKLKDAVTEKTKVIFCVNLLGNSNCFDEIDKIKRNAIILEDNCESMGAKYNQKYCGTIGLMGTFSTFFSHHIATMEGGVVVTDNEELYQIMLCLRAHGWTRNLPQNNLVSNKGENDFYESFRFVLPGYNLRPIEIEASIGVEQLQKLDDIVYERRKNAKYFKEVMSKQDKLLIQQEIGSSSWFGFSLVVNPQSQINRSKVLELAISMGFEVRPIVAGNFTRNEAVKYFDYEIFGDLANSNIVHDNGFFVGNHHYNIKEMVDDLYRLTNSI